MHKKSQYCEGFIAPTQPRSDACFAYGRDGSIGPASTAVAEDVKQTVRILNLKHPALLSFRRDYLAAVEGAIAAMAAQPDAVIEYLRVELSLDGSKPFYSAKRQHFGLPEGIL